MAFNHEKEAIPLPTLRQVLPENADYDHVSALLDTDVIAVKLNTGAPCSSHTGPFMAWPGEGADVKQWFVLSNGKAVAINEDSDGVVTCPIIDYVEAEDA